MRVGEAQPWPALRRYLAWMPSTLSSVSSKSGRTMSGDLPPSSSTMPVTCSTHWLMIAWPTSTDPVNETRSTSWRLVSTAPMSGPPTITLSTPGGSSASSAISPSISDVSGVRGDGSSTVVQPAAMAAPIFDAASISG